MGLVHQESQRNNLQVGYQHLNAGSYCLVNTGLLAWSLKSRYGGRVERAAIWREMERRGKKAGQALRRHGVVREISVPLES